MFAYINFCLSEILTTKARNDFFEKFSL